MSVKTCTALVLAVLVVSTAARAEPREVVLQGGHGGAAIAVAWSPDGRLLASGGLDGLVRIWDAQTGVLRARLPGHVDAVTGLAWSADGATLASGGDGVIFLRDARTFAITRALPSSHGSCYLAFSPDGRTLAVSSGGTGRVESCGQVRLLDVASGVERPGPPVEYVWGMAWSPAPGSALVAASTMGKVTLWDARTAQTVAELEGSYLGFSGDGRLLVTVGETSQAVKVFDGTTGTLRQTLAPTPARAVAVSPDGARLAIGYQSVDAQLWPVGAAGGGGPVALAGSVGAWRLAFSPDGRWLAAVGETRLALFDGATGTSGPTLQDDDDTAWAVAFSPDGGTLAVGEKDAIALWSLGPYAPPRALPAAKTPQALAFSPDGKLLAEGDAGRDPRYAAEGGFSLWDLAAGTVRLRDDDPTARLLFSPDGRVLATGDPARTLILRDGRRGTRGAAVAWTPGDTGMCDPEILDGAWSPDGATLALDVECGGGAFFTARGQPAPPPHGWTPPWALVPRLGHQPLLSSNLHAVPAPDRRTLLLLETLGAGSAWALLDRDAGQWVARGRGPVHAVAWRPDGRFFATAGPAGVELVRVADGAVLGLHRVRGADGVAHLALAADGTMAGDAAALRAVLARTGDVRTGVMGPAPPELVRPSLIADFLAPVAPPADAMARLAVARTLLAAAGTLAALHEPEEAIVRAGDVARRFGEDADPALRAVVTHALLVLGVAEAEIEMDRELAWLTLDEVARRLGDPDDAPRRLELATALGHKARIAELRYERASAALTYARLLAVTAGHDELAALGAGARLGLCRVAGRPHCEDLARAAPPDAGRAAADEDPLAPGKRLLTAGKATEALAFFAARLRRGDEGEARLGRGRALLALHRDAEALRDFEANLQADSQRCANLAGRSVALVRIGRAEKAGRVFEALRSECHDEDAAVHPALAQAYFEHAEAVAAQAPDPRAAYQDLLILLGDSADPEVQPWVVKARARDVALRGPRGAR